MWIKPWWYHEVINSYSVWKQGSLSLSPLQFWNWSNVSLKFRQTPKQLYLFYSTRWDLSNYIWHMTIWAVWCFWHIRVHGTIFFFLNYEKNIYIYPKITQHYLGVNQSGQMHCKGQTPSFQMMPILCWSRHCFWKIWFFFFFVGSTLRFWLTRHHWLGVDQNGWMYSKAEFLSFKIIPNYYKKMY